MSKFHLVGDPTSRRSIQILRSNTGSNTDSDTESNTGSDIRPVVKSIYSHPVVVRILNETGRKLTSDTRRLY